MNVTLNNQLVAAVNVLREDKQKFVSEIDTYNQKIKKANDMIASYRNSSRHIPVPATPKQLYQKQQLSMILLLLFVWPVGIPYAIYFSLTKKKRERENNEKYVVEMTEYNKKIDDLRNLIAEENRKIEEYQKLIANIESKRQRFFQANHTVLGFIPKPYRNLKATTRLYSLIHDEYAFTLSDAINRYEREIQELIELEERIEARERAERLAEQHHREIQKTLDDIEYNLRH